jgi:transketolase
MDGPRKASSGHSGTAMALAPLAHVLFSRVMRYDPDEPLWSDRDRFVLSAGHASILLYSMLHLNGFDLDIDDLEQFRQLGSRTPGHPEHGMTQGVEVTTGPLGQGVANAVGMAIAERHLRATHGEALCDHRIWCIAGDGCLEEGISHEAASLAGHLGLGRLVCIYDDNKITIDGPTSLALNDDPAARFRAYGWHVLELDGVENDLDALEAALRDAAAVEDQPSMLVLKTHIGWPSERYTDDAFAHGNPFPPEEIAATKERMGLDPKLSFSVPPELYDHYRDARAESRAAREAWHERLGSAGEQGVAYLRQLEGDVTAALATPPPTFEEGASIATRRAFGTCINASAPLLPGLISGSADLTENTGTEIKGATIQSAASPEGIQLHFGVREHAMGGVMTGMALHGGILPVGGTFFVFSDYMRGAVRVAAVSGAHVIYVFTHDSIGVGEDGPTHQPVEQLAAMRAMPEISVLRPADAHETAAAWRVALESSGPVALILSRQNVPVLEETRTSAMAGVKRGGYVIARRGEGRPEVVLVATGSEVSLALKAADLLAEEGHASSVVSLPSFDRFDQLSPSDRSEVLPESIPVLSVEAATTFGWAKYADASIGIDRFGASAPAGEIFAMLGLTPERVAAEAQALIGRPVGPVRRRTRPA